MLQVERVAGGEGQTVVAATGQIDLATAPELAEALNSAVAEAVSEVVVDLAGVDFMDSAGVRVLVDAARKADQADIKLSVRGARDWVARVLEITGVEDFLHLTPSEPSASADPGQ